MCRFCVRQRLCFTEILFPSYDLYQGNGSGGSILDVAGSGNVRICTELNWFRRSSGTKICTDLNGCGISSTGKVFVLLVQEDKREFVPN